MIGAVMIVFYALVTYLGIGLGIAVPFVLAGIPHVMGAPVALTAGARLMLIPGAVALWPIVLRRWLGAGARA